MSATLTRPRLDDTFEDFPAPGLDHPRAEPPPPAPFALLDASRVRLQAELAAHCKMLAELARLRQRMVRRDEPIDTDASARQAMVARLPSVRSVRDGAAEPLTPVVWREASGPRRISGRPTRPAPRTDRAPAPIEAPLDRPPVWMAATAFAAALLCAGGTLAVLWHGAAEAWSTRALADAVERRPFDPGALALALADESDPSYPRARAEAMLAAAKAESDGVGLRGAVGPASEQALRAVADDRPGRPWARLTLAKATERDDPHAWAALAGHPDPAPEFRRALGDHLLSAGKLEAALAAYRVAAAGRPEWTRELLKSLAAARTPLEQRWTIVPAEPRGELAAVEHLQFDERQGSAAARAQDALRRLGSAPALAAPADRVAFARLKDAADDLAGAAAELATAVQAEPRTEWLLLLAEWRYRQRRFDDCETLAAAALEREPAGHDAAAARQWRNKARLARGGQETP